MQEPFCLPAFLSPLRGKKVDETGALVKSERQKTFFDDLMFCWSGR